MTFTGKLMTFREVTFSTPSYIIQPILFLNWQCHTAKKNRSDSGVLAVWQCHRQRPQVALISSLRYLLFFFIAVLHPGKVSVGFLEGVRSFLAEQGHAWSNRDPIQVKNYICFAFCMFCAPDVVHAGPFGS